MPKGTLAPCSCARSPRTWHPAGRSGARTRCAARHWRAHRPGHDPRRALDDRRVATHGAGRGSPDGVAVVCALHGDMSFRGLVAADTAHPGTEYEAAWGDVAALAGRT